MSGAQPSADRTPESPASVFEALAKIGDVKSRIVLEPQGDPQPQADVPQHDSEGRYIVLGEIARGGVGVVMRSRDVDLGRDVAMKVLRDEFAENEDVLQRFIEEAQIGGQLQHPGIVPVYEMGLTKAGRPYFTMKLVKGETLAALLQERKSEPDARDSRIGGRLHLLHVFESVCETMAYAHSRGVVHRDLKPSNIMVGSFGQVLVVDWGLAKVKTRGGVADEREAKKSMQPLTVIATVRSGSDSGGSMVGSVMGTPGYMPPEQARGDVENMNERSDVFALGAILCEILTGKPPYVGTDREMIIQAARAQLDGARERLHACGAEEALVSLADACLSPAPMSRPRDAGDVLAELAKHFASIETRAQLARRSATAAQIRAAEARRGRRLTTSIAATVVGVVLVAGASGVWQLGERESRRATTRANVRAVMDEAEQVSGRAQIDDETQAWDEAELAARRAMRLAVAGEADDETRAAAAALHAKIEESRAAARRAEDSIEQRMRLIRRLNALRMDAWTLDPRDAAERYAAAFGEYGVDPDALGRAEVISRIRDAGPQLSVRLATAMDAWAAARRRAGLSDGVYRDIARSADDDPWRTGLRDATSIEDLRELAAAPDLAQLPLESLSTLASSLAEAGDVDGAADVAATILVGHPGDLWAHSQYAIWLVSGRAARPEDAIEHSAVAVALRPDVAEAWANHAWVLVSAGDYYDARAACAEAIRIDPENPLARALLGHADGLIGDRDTGVVHLEEAIVQKPELAIARSWLGRLLAKMGREDAARAQFEEAVRLEPRSARALRDLARFLFETGRFGQGLRAWERSVAADPRYLPARLELAVALVQLGDWGGAEVHARKAVELSPSSPTHLANLALVLGMLGHREEELEIRRDLAQVSPGDALNQFLLSKVFGLLGRPDDSVSAVRRYRVLAQRNRNVTEAAIEVEARLQRGRIASGQAAIQDLDDVERYCTTITKSRAGAARVPALVLLAATLQRRDEGGFWRAEALLRQAAELLPPGAARDQLDEQYEMTRKIVALASEVSVDALDRGVHAPRDFDEAVVCGQAAALRGRFAASAAYLTRALQIGAPSPDEESLVRNEAVRSAVLAGTGQGEDADGLTPRESRRLRADALDWMREDLRIWTERLDESPRDHGLALANALRSWFDAPDLAFVRSRAHVANLPSSEQAGFRAFWSDVRDTLRLEGEKRRELLVSDPSRECLRAFMGQRADALDRAYLRRLHVLANGRSFAARQLVGPPEILYQVGNLRAVGIWVPLAQSAGEEWLELDFETGVHPAELRVFEMRAQGSVSSVSVMTADGRWTIVWEGRAERSEARAPSVFDLSGVEEPISSVRVEFDTTRHPRRWTYISGVQLVGDGLELWPIDARASSTYADR